ncbi:4'-phosphopantetheinyl transferase superfamily protein [Paraglaciecola aquimarina]|uniref:4'-phosphopantetheinyl transferase superfamily protein n=1 Tax=Paraglaciecola aquimarina TaxID=1235557 RepID=A0ABU3SSM5_9ALTE|nr:4'-phosphopantetheinyl transferase superfamily protein [Paraglaciecola aquimarina]MDU0353026.1 4'-phosphopantetheinyl transferase superfamily protein [Paraglaciecola aquimarina]
MAFKSKAKKRQFGLARYLIKYCLQARFAIPLEHDYQLVDYQNWLLANDKKCFYVSISHSQHIVAVVVSDKECHLGVDVEQHKQRDFAALATMFMTAKERGILQSSAEQSAVFYRLWTAKEAYFKAVRIPTIELSQVDLSQCLIDGNVKVKGYQYHYQTLGQNDYSLTVLSQTRFNGKVQGIGEGIESKCRPL